MNYHQTTGAADPLLPKAPDQRFTAVASLPIHIPHSRIPTGSASGGRHAGEAGMSGLIDGSQYLNEGGPLDMLVRRLVDEGVNTRKMTSNERHDYVVRTFPGGLNGLQFAALTLLSADDDEVVDPPSVGDFFQKQSLILRLCLDGLIERRCRRDEAGPYYLAAKGRAQLERAAEQPRRAGQIEGVSHAPR